MECDKDEAIRAKVVAQEKMESNDFKGAQKMALKAQQLFPKLENINQLLTVCQVHCSAQKRLMGSEKDWYDILQVEKLADELAVKKQYRRLAFNLHPDKNQLPGAEAAFKLICEANNVLSDPTLKSIYDSKLRVIIRSASVNQSHHRSSTPNVQNLNQTTTTTRLEMFWTICPHCGSKCQYDHKFLHCEMCCPTCSKNFVAYKISSLDIFAHMPPQSSAVSKNMGSPSEAEGPTEIKQNMKVEEEDNGRANNSDGVAFGCKNGDVKNVIPERACRRNVAKKPSINGNADLRERSGSLSWRMNGHKDSECKKKDGVPSKPDLSKKRSSVEKDGNCDEDSKVKKTKCQMLQNGDSEKYSIHVPDPDFSDFDKIREEKHFATDQFWARYDQYDSMPRYYVKVTKVSTSPFELRFRWLEVDPVEESHRKWVSSDLPVGCGNFKFGKTGKTSKLCTFSHQVHFETGRTRGSLSLYPREGEIWAVFRGWNFNWSSKPENHRKCKYDVVEVLSDFTADAGSIRVCYLSKVRNFISLFRRRTSRNNGEDDSFLIAPDELYRFAHKIPSFKLSGTKREKGVPKGSFELDPASLPPDTDDLYDAMENEKDSGKTSSTLQPNGKRCKSMRSQRRKYQQ